MLIHLHFLGCIYVSSSLFDAFHFLPQLTQNVKGNSLSRTVFTRTVSLTLSLISGSGSIRIHESLFGRYNNTNILFTETEEQTSYLLQRKLFRQEARGRIAFIMHKALQKTFLYSLGTNFLTYISEGRAYENTAVSWLKLLPRQPTYISTSSLLLCYQYLQNAK